jgi:hypothetical protein
VEPAGKEERRIRNHTVPLTNSLGSQLDYMQPALHLLSSVIGVARATLAPGPPQYDHAAVRHAIVAAMNDFATAPSALLALLEDDAEWCDPFPDCVYGKENISAFLNSMPPGTDTVLLAEPMVTVGSVGGFMSTLSFSWPGKADDCLYTADQHVSWNVSTSTSGGNGAAPPKLQYVRWVYNASEFDSAIQGCLGRQLAAVGPQMAAARVLRRTLAATPGREADLVTVKDYVVGLQYSLAAQARICDLLVPTARYCDPFPVRCAIGRSGCREMKGLPPGEEAEAQPEGQKGPEAALPLMAIGSSASEQCRPASVRPLMPTGPITGAMYIAYSSASRNALGTLSHKLHHTWAIFELAPPNSSQPAPAPLLASFDWFMPDHNV